MPLTICCMRLGFRSRADPAFLPAPEVFKRWKKSYIEEWCIACGRGRECTNTSPKLREDLSVADVKLSNPQTYRKLRILPKMQDKLLENFARSLCDLANQLSKQQSTRIVDSSLCTDQVDGTTDVDVNKIYFQIVFYEACAAHH